MDFIPIKEEPHTMYGNEATGPNVPDENATTSMYGLLDLSVRQPGHSDHSYSIGQCSATRPVLIVAGIISEMDFEDELKNLTEEVHPWCTFGPAGESSSGELIMCPSLKALLLKNDECKIPCPFSGCDKILTRHSSVARHLQVHYRSSQVLKPQGDFPATPRTSFQMIYYCPVQGCSYSKNVNDRQFLSLKYLKQHFNKVHAPKKYVCCNCKTERFATKAYLDGHQRVCGIKFTCKVCPTKVYKTLEALQTHARRHNHPLDLIKYKAIINASKPLKSPAPSFKTPPARPGPKKLPPLIPKVGYNPTSLARVILSFPTPFPRVLIDCGSQTGPPVKRGVKRTPSASQQCQTHSMETRTTGTETQLPALTRTLERKKSAETQTKKLRISTQTQTPVVTKRKRSTRNMQSSSMETQTSFKAVNPIEPPQVSVTLNPLPPSQLDVVAPSASVDEVPSAKRTQTDPNPFFGLNRDSDSILSEFEVFFTDSEVRSMMNQTSAETQTVIGANSHIYLERALPTVVDPTNTLVSGEELYFHASTAVQRDFGGSESDIDHYENYLETMDSETQTFESAAALDHLFFP